MGSERSVFIKQETEYELAECDWSSDVCTSDVILGIYIRRDTMSVLDLQRDLD